MRRTHLVLVLERHHNFVVGLVPGTALGCWDSHYTHERCCVEMDESCFAHNPRLSDACCSAYIETLQGGHTESFNLLGRTVAQDDAPLALTRCVFDRAPVNSSYWQGGQTADNFTDNNFLKAARCVAQLPENRLILDVFLGGGHTARAMLEGLSERRHRSRSAEVFSFEYDAKKLRVVFGTGGKLADHHPVERLAVSTKFEVMALQRRLLTAPPSGKLQLWVLEGSPYIGSLEDTYLHNALDVLCFSRGSFDVVLIDSTPAANLEAVWSIIEAVCQPKWVLIANINLPHGSGGWIHHRLEMLGNWVLQLAGHYSVSALPFGPAREMRRQRSWSVWRRMEFPSASFSSWASL